MTLGSESFSGGAAHLEQGKDVRSRRQVNSAFAELDVRCRWLGGLGIVVFDMFLLWNTALLGLQTEMTFRIWKQKSEEPGEELNNDSAFDESDSVGLGYIRAAFSIEDQGVTANIIRSRQERTINSGTYHRYRIREKDQLSFPPKS
ncbi:hypothetical protein R3P38DRAFT_2810389 [Favolaschia claudopus]|uniref:Uncharacterized protein n=1 Tax=Favolaschia claudopus TaxID=2862362 RepID=A0AAV9ZAQ5_9AGAR